MSYIVHHEAVFLNVSACQLNREDTHTEEPELPAALLRCGGDSAGRSARPASAAETAGTCTNSSIDNGTITAVT
jgi:hypothetical protein